MPYPDWPDAVPHKMLLDDFQLQQSHLPPLRSEMESGQARMRPKFTKRIATVRCSIQMTVEQYQAFDDFVILTLKQGSSKFTMPISKRGAYTDRTCQLADGTYSASPNGLGWKVSFNLMVENY